jgi:plasmid stability protein
MEAVMKSITIHNIENDLDKKISAKSKEYGLSQNRTVKEILRKALLSDRAASRREQFADLFGTWTSADKKAFEERIADFEKIDKSDWDE